MNRLASAATQVHVPTPVTHVEEEEKAQDVPQPVTHALPVFTAKLKREKRENKINDKKYSVYFKKFPLSWT